MFQGAPALWGALPTSTIGLLLRAAPPAVQDHLPLVRVRAPPRAHARHGSPPDGWTAPCSEDKACICRAGSAPPRAAAAAAAVAAVAAAAPAAAAVGAAAAAAAPAWSTDSGTGTCDAWKSSTAIALRRARRRRVGDDADGDARVTHPGNFHSYPAYYNYNADFGQFISGGSQATRNVDKWCQEAGCCCALCAADPSCVAWQVLFKDDCVDSYCGSCGPQYGTECDGSMMPNPFKMCVRISEELFSPPPEMQHESLTDLAAWKARRGWQPRLRGDGSVRPRRDGAAVDAAAAAAAAAGASAPGAGSVGGDSRRQHVHGVHRRRRASRCSRRSPLAASCLP